MLAQSLLYTGRTPEPLQTDRMSHQLVIDLTRDAILTALMVAAPLLLIALGIGLLVSIIQSVTQIQEQTLSFVPKLVLVGGAFIVGMPWLLQILIKFTTQIIRGIPAMVA
jgi:flagellar biosynthesis protein FliQ